MEKQETAIDWLLKKITLKKLDNEIYLYPKLSNQEIEQAKEIYEKQMIEYGRFCVQCEKQGFIIPKNNQLCK
jgi:hypothetical protein